MCGIAAIIGPNIQNRENIKKMIDSAIHRGPDGEGFFHEDFISLGHRRLAIIDLEASSNQPMQYKHLWIVYNGEVFNYIELRSELIQLGHKFKTQSDTEVILAAYLEWGKSSLDRLNGMFSFVIYNTESKSLFAARDRFGIKPFYYWQNNSQIFIASEIKQFSTLPAWKAQLNWQMAFDFLNHSLLDHTENTLFKNVFQLRPGHYFEIDLTQTAPEARPQQWYNLSSHKNNPQKKSSPQDFLNLLKDSIKLRQRSDVSVGSCLSGGLDSSGIVCLLNENLKYSGAQEKQKTFSACSDVSQFDEKKFIDVVVEKTGVDAHYTYPSPEDLFKVLEKLTWHQDEPFGSTSIFAQWCVFELAAKNQVKVMLDGQGADEEMGGYHSFFGIYWSQLFKNFKWLTLFKELKAAHRKHSYSYLSIVKMIAVVLTPPFLVPLFKKLDGRNTHSYFHFPANLRQTSPHRILNSKASMQEHSLSLVTSTNLQMLLHWEDRNSMAHSIEARVPFLDYRIVEFCLNLSDEQKIKEATTKVILREALAGSLPERIKNRQDKLGFVTPEVIWMKQRLPQQFRKALEDAVSLSHGLIDRKILEDYDLTVQGKKTYDNAIWRAISFGVWVRVFGVEL
ncbi:MAG: asparagine synthase (glutamine-hydrolyzing) [Pseudobdellovibrio sp.]